MARTASSGFTLIELLTVIAIIAILAAMVVVVGPRMIMKARMTSFTATCNQIRNASVAYYTKNHDSYPPGYGFRKPSAPEPNQVQDETDRFFLEGYMQRIQMFRLLDAYDKFSQDTYDTDKDGTISLLEYYPIGIEDPTKGQYHYVWPVFRYVMNLTQAADPLHGRTFGDEIRDAKSQQRPLVYIPINTKQYQNIANIYYKNANDTSLPANARRAWWYMESWAQERLFPGVNTLPVPAKYDDYILISVGPSNDTGGILTPPNSFLAELQAKVHPDFWYQVLAIRAYWLATRDANGNHDFDFDYRNRTTGTEGKPGSYPDASMNLNLLPNGSNGPGPLIYKP